MSRSLLEIILNINKRGSGATQAEKELSALEKTTKGLNSVLGVFGLALTTKAVFDFANASREANRVEKDSVGALEEAAKGIADYSEALRLGREATKGMASDQQIAASEAVLFGAGLATNAQQAADLASAGTVLSNVFASAGASQELFVRLLSSGSQVLFNNFGITNQMVKAKQAELEATRGLHGEEARMQAIKEVLIGQANRYKDSLSEETIAAGQAETAQKNFMSAFGGLVNELDKATGATGLTTWFLDLETQGAKAWGTVFEGIGALSAMNRAAIEASGVGEDYMNTLAGITDTGEEAASAEETLAGAVDKAAGIYGPASGASQQLAADQLHLADAANIAAAAFGDQATAAQAAMRLTLATSNQLDEATAAAGAFGGQMDSFTSNRMITGIQAAGDARLQAQAEQQQAEEESQRKSEQTAKRFQQSFTQAADQIGNTISGKLQTTFQEVFKLPEGSTDQADEPARRLATVAASGFGSEWLTQLNAQFAGQDFWAPMTAAMQSGSGEQLQAAATGILQQFSQGLITNLFDVNVIRGQVRAEMVQKRLREQLIEEVRAGLGTEGISQAIGVVQMAAGDVGAATATTEANVSTMAASAEVAGAKMKTSFDGTITQINIAISRLQEAIGLTERWGVVAGQTAGKFNALNPPAAGSGLVPNGAQRKMGGQSPL